MHQSLLPTAQEYAPHFDTYISQAGVQGILPTLHHGLHTIETYLHELPEARLSHAYAPSKWTVAQVLVHLMDAERVFSYRALTFLRGDETALPGFDENLFAVHSLAEMRSKEDIWMEYQAIRAATIALYQYTTPESLRRQGIASGNMMSVRAIAYIIAGHEQHHLRVLRERYI